MRLEVEHSYHYICGSCSKVTTLYELSILPSMTCPYCGHTEAWPLPLTELATDEPSVEGVTECLVVPQA